MNDEICYIKIKSSGDLIRLWWSDNEPCVGGNNVIGYTIFQNKREYDGGELDVGSSDSITDYIEEVLDFIGYEDEEYVVVSNSDKVEELDEELDL